MDTPSQILTSISLLVIEDSEDDFELIVRRLRKSGLTVAARRVQTAKELAAALLGTPYDAVIADHRLPSFGSLEALELVRQFDSDMPFLVVSGAMGEELAVDAMRGGADDYVMKNRLARLVPALERALKVAATRRARRKAEAALAESETRFKALTANLPGVVFQMRARDGVLSLLYVSEGSRRVLNVAPEALMAGRATLFGALIAEDAADLHNALAHPDDALPFLLWEARLDPRRREGERWVEVAARARTLSSGNVFWDGIVSDVTIQKRAQQELRELASHITHLREEEREVIAREIHDDVGSTLTAVKFDLAWLKKELKANPGALSRLQQVDHLVDSVILSSSRIMHDLRPGILDDGIVASLEWQARAFEQRLDIPCAFRASHEDVELDRDQAIAVFRICQEALNNIAKHAGATRVSVTVDAGPSLLTLEIRDNGKGLDDADIGKRSCFGLRGMRERAISLGGKLSLGRNAPQGTVILLSLPLDKSHALARRDARTA